MINNAIQVSNKQDHPDDLRSWVEFLQKKGHETEIREVTTSKGPKYVLYRSYDPDERDIPEKGYWVVVRGSFCRVER